MDISKTQFKEYSKCHNYLQNEEIYKTKTSEIVSNEEVRDMLSKMFDEDGEDLIEITDEQIEIMLPYYQETERLALKEASITFGKEFVYHQNTKEQQNFSIQDKEGNTLYTYLDGYYEDKDEIIIIEVKSTTTRKFMECGPKVKGVQTSIFQKDANIITLKNKLSEKELQHINKVYDRYSDVGKYVFDLAITQYIVSEAIKKDPIRAKKKITYYLGILNSSYIYPVSSDDPYFTEKERLFCFIDLTKPLQTYHDKINQLFIDIVNNKELKKPIYQKPCIDCVFKYVCFNKLKEKYAITTLLIPKKIENESVIDLINKEYYSIKDIPFNNFEKANHIIQRNAIYNEKEYIDVKQIQEQLNEIKYPIYHLDFEAFACPLPRFFGEKPYMQSVFQYSIHIQKGKGICDRYKDNYYYLPTDFQDHREDLIKEMIKTIDLSNGGTVLVYNKAFECTRIKELIRIFPKYEKELQRINDHIFDLMYVIKGHDVDSVNYYHHLLNGSYSIKKVLPLFSNLTYKTMEVKNGVDAVVAYGKFKTYNQEDINELREKLIKYCGLDTYSMVVILDEIQRRINNE